MLLESEKSLKLSDTRAPLRTNGESKSAPTGLLAALAGEAGGLSGTITISGDGSYQTPIFHAGSAGCSRSARSRSLSWVQPPSSPTESGSVS